MIIAFEQPAKWWETLLEAFPKKFDGQKVTALALVAITDESVLMTLEADDEHMVELIGALEVAKLQLNDKL